MEMIKSRKNIDTSRFLGALGMLLVPALYSLLRMYFVVNMQSDITNIIAQSSWINLTFEILSEGMILPMYFIINKAKEEKRDLQPIISVYFSYTVFVTIVFAIIVKCYLPQLATIMEVPSDILKDTILCNSLELIGAVWNIVIQFLMLLALFDDKRVSVLHKVILVRFVVGFACDIAFLSNYKIVDVGVLAPASSNIVSQIIMVVIVLYLLNKVNLMPKCNLNITYVTKEYLSRCTLLMVEVLVRNLAFSLMIIKLINTVQEQGTYWIANQIIWSWLLIPCLAISDVIRAVGIQKENAKAYLRFVHIIALLYVGSLFLCKPFMEYILKIEDTTSVMGVLMIQAPFYIIFIYNSMIDSLFHHLGKSKELLIQSILVNTIYYGTLAILYYLNVVEFSLEKIALMFGVGILLDFFVTLYQARGILPTLFGREIGDCCKADESAK
ncbi:MAG: hypothetical protein R3Y54_01935 [Eubacteriales bacterium]